MVRAALADDPGFLDGWLLLVNLGMELNNRDLAREALIHLRQAMNNGMFSRFVDEQLSVLGNDG